MRSVRSYARRTAAWILNAFDLFARCAPVIKALAVASVVAIGLYPTFAVARDQQQPLIDIPTAVRSAADTIRVRDLLKDVEFLASDAMLGRATGSPELERAAEYISTALKTARVRTFGDKGSYFQQVPFGVAHLDSSCSHLTALGARLTMHDGWRVSLNGPPPTASAAGPARLVYVQHGWVSKQLGLDPYEGLDLRGKIAVMTEYPGGGQRLRADRARASDFVLPWTAAAARGAIAEIDLEFGANWDVPPPGTTNPDASTSRHLRASLMARTAILAAPWMNGTATGTPSIPHMTASRRTGDAIFARESVTATELVSRAVRGDANSSFELNPATTVSFQVCFAAQPPESMQNVVAVVEGRDPVLKDEYIVIGAHYDGQGVQLVPERGRPLQNDDSILNSANDNATGTAGLMAIARAFARGPRPARSVIFAWFAGEELGIGLHAGSQFFVSSPPVPLPRVKAMVNLDMLSPDPGGTIFLGFSNPALRDAALSINASYHRVALRPFSGRGGGGSDRDEFAAKGIPWLAFEADGGDLSHSVRDETRTIDFRGVERVARTAYVTAWRLANEERIPGQ